MTSGPHRVPVGIGACLLGEKVRYDGGHKRERHLTDTPGRYFDWVPVCPELEMGLGVPREALRLEGDPRDPNDPRRRENFIGRVFGYRRRPRRAIEDP
jgi:uncharacterized protein YbbK (DUF523 family)